MTDTCPCKMKSCSRHGDCEACRKHHEESKRKRPVYCEKDKSKGEKYERNSDSDKFRR